MIRPIKKILIANRGEIASRIIRTCKHLGIRTVAVYSEADRRSPHVREADEAIFIGPAGSRESYLHINKILNAAKETGADAIHPGYGFLSENDVFAAEVEKAGLVFIGPSAFSIKMMGNKLAAKKAASEFNIPMVPGTDYPVKDIQQAEQISNEIGFPVLIKAAAGGGGKGMRIVQEASDIRAQVERAMSEAMSSFGDSSVFIEKYITSPRHIEIQVMADQHGQCIHLLERECSIQRRHQKIVEEAPSSILSSEQRNAMGQDAVKVALACQYTGAGTVEFLLDEHGNHYFLEMNTRLQVEHPVTEMVTGLDLVEMQIRIAEGYPITISQDKVTAHGHAIELRVYAENAENKFSPSTGTLIKYRPPFGPGIRVDDGFEEGMEVPIHYDPMLSKLIAYGKTRDEAIRIMSDAITKFEVEGVHTTLEFGSFAVNHPAFVSGNFDTHFVEKHMDEFLKEQEHTNNMVATFASWYYDKQKRILVLPRMD